MSSEKAVIDEPIRIKGDWKEEDHVLAHELAYPLTKGKQWSLIGVMSFMLAAGIACITFLEGPQAIVVGVFMIVMSIVVGTGAFWFPPMIARMEVKKAIKESRQCDVQLLTNDLRWLGFNEPITKPWEKFYAIILHPQIIVLFEAKRKYELLPRHLFESQEDWDLVQNVIRQAKIHPIELDAQGNKIK